MATSLINKLTAGDSDYTRLNGTTPTTPDLALSKLHYTYSINGNPSMTKLEKPSQMDLNGEIPAFNYRDNAPEGRTF